MKNILWLMIIGFSINIHSFIVRIDDGKLTPVTSSGGVFTLSGSGKYLVRSDLTTASTSAGDPIIKITGSNITLDLQDFSVKNTNGRGIDVGPSGAIENLRILNGTVHDCTSDGIRVQNSTKLLMQNMLMTDNSSNGIDFSGSCTNMTVVDCRADSNGGDGFKAVNGDLFDFRNCIASDNTDSGFELQFIENSTIESCIASSNVNTTNFDGIRLDGVTNFTVKNTKCYNNTINGLSVRGDSTGIDIEDCESVGNSETGINVVTPVTNIVIEHCSVKNNTKNGVFCGGQQGVISNSIFIGNAVSSSDANVSAIRLDSNAAQVHINGNKLVRNGLSGTTVTGAIFVDPGASVIDIFENRVLSNFGTSGGGINAQPTAAGNFVVVGNYSARNNTPNFSLGTSVNSGVTTLASAAVAKWGNIQN